MNSGSPPDLPFNPDKHGSVNWASEGPRGLLTQLGPTSSCIKCDPAHPCCGGLASHVSSAATGQRDRVWRPKFYLLCQKLFWATSTQATHEKAFQSTSHIPNKAKHSSACVGSFFFFSFPALGVRMPEASNFSEH